MAMYNSSLCTPITLFTVACNLSLLLLLYSKRNDKKATTTTTQNKTNIRKNLYTRIAQVSLIYTRPNKTVSYTILLLHAYYAYTNDMKTDRCHRVVSFAPHWLLASFVLSYSQISFCWFSVTQFILSGLCLFKSKR